MIGRFRFLCFFLLFILVSCSTSSTTNNPTAPESSEPPRVTVSPDNYDEVPSAETETREVSIVLPGAAGPEKITVDVVDGAYLYEGDIIVAEEDEIVTQAAALSLKRRLWPNGIVPYKIDSSLSSRAAEINAAIAHWNDKTNVSIVALSNVAPESRQDYLLFRKGNGCSSKLGKVGGAQRVTLSPKCSKGSIIHEIGHAVGLFHEQSRSDRDQFITIVENNIKSGKGHNFRKHTSRPESGQDIGAYDYASIMHYAWYAFSKNCTKSNFPDCEGTIVPKGNVDKSSIGQRVGLSAGDIAAINNLYPKNKAPTINNFSASPDAGPGPLDTTFSWQIVDPNDADTLSCTLDTNSDGNVEYSFDCRTKTSQQHKYTALDAHKATLIVTDGKNPAVAKSVFVSVEASDENQPPTVEAGSSQTLSFDDAKIVSLAGVVTDDGFPDTPASLKVLWTKLSGPGLVSFSNASSANTTASFSESGSYVLNLSADDGEIVSEDQVSIVIEEGAPIIKSFEFIKDQSENGLLGVEEFAFFAAVAQGGVEGAYSWSVSPTALTEEQIDRTSPDGEGAISFAIAFGSVGPHEVCVQVSDSEGQASDRFCETVTVTNNVVTVSSATFTESVSGGPAGFAFATELSGFLANISRGSFSGTLSGVGRYDQTFNCSLPEEPDKTLDTAIVTYTESYTAAFSGMLDSQSGGFNTSFNPEGNTSFFLKLPFNHPDCRHLNDNPAPGLGPWSGSGSVSGSVSEEGLVSIRTNWTLAGTSIRGSWTGQGELQ